jgi:uncharacterized protein YbjT (DUF2867 family)
MVGGDGLNVVIFGATGVAGAAVLYECLKHPRISRVVAVTRRSLGIDDDKFSEIIHTDFLDYSAIEGELKGFDACFWNLGVSQLHVRDEETYRRITYDYTFAAANVLARLNPDMTFCFLTGLGTDPTMRSRQMWARVKGQAERDLEDLPFGAVYVYRPGVIIPTKADKTGRGRWRGSVLLWPLFRLISPKLVIRGEEYGLGMINAALYRPELRVLENRDIVSMAREPSD